MTNIVPFGMQNNPLKFWVWKKNPRGPHGPSKFAILPLISVFREKHLFHYTKSYQPENSGKLFLFSRPFQQVPTLICLKWKKKNILGALWAFEICVLPLINIFRENHLLHYMKSYQPENSCKMFLSSRTFQQVPICICLNMFASVIFWC